MKSKVLFYVSGHGFGHSVRMTEVISSLKDLHPDLSIYIRTTAPRWLYERGLKTFFRFDSVKIDAGMVQKDALTVDIDRTVEALTDLYDRSEEIIDKEAAFAEDNGIDMAVADIPDMAFDIAARAGIPGIGIANFTWDWIYEKTLPDSPVKDRIITGIKDNYEKAQAILAPPMNTGLEGKENIINIPLIARKSTKDREEFRNLLDVPRTSCLVLLSFGGFGPGYIDVTPLGNMDGYYFLSLTPYDDYPPNLKSIPRGLYQHHDLVNAADIVISKPGYGIAAECITNGTPLIYAERRDFPEVSFIVETLETNHRSLYIPASDLRKGDILPYLEKIRRKKEVRPSLKTGGGKEAARILLDFLVKKAALNGR